MPIHPRHVVKNSFLLVVPALALLAGCGQAPPEPAAATPLLDLYEAESVEGAVAAASRPPSAEWRFADPDPEGGRKGASPTREWKAGPGVKGLALVDGRLAGTSTGDFPVLHVERTAGLDDKDIVHALEVRMRVSAGANMSAALPSSEKLDLAEAVAEARDFPWMMTTPIVPGDTMRTYRLTRRRGLTVAEARHVLLRPTDAAGARFEIESIRLVSRREHLAGIRSGPGWQGLSEVYRETLVSRSPETIAVSLVLPERPWLDLGVGTPEDGPITFRVAVSDDASRKGGETVTLLERTVTRPHRWEDARVDLQRFAGRKVTLRLTLASERAGALGFWGSPVVRSRGAAPSQSAVAAAGGAGRPAAPQGVIVIWADTLRQDHLDVYGYARETTPVLRRLAREGVLFTQCVSQATWTKVATPSLMTSLYPTSHTVKEFNDRLPSSAVTLAEVYREAGYATLSMSSILFVGAFTNLHQGFQELHEDGSLPDQESSKTAREYVDRLLPWLEARRDVPFFAFLHVSDPHDPYRPYPPYDTMWADPAKRAEHERQAAEVRKFIAEPLMKRFGMPTRAELERAGFDAAAYVAHDVDWYDGSIRAMDAEIGRLIERLGALGLDRRTLVVFTGDHGEEFLEHGRTFHGQSVYGELTNVPLLMWGPGTVPAGGVVGDVVEIIDVMPTLLEIAGLAQPEGLQGRSFLPLLRGAGTAPSRAGSTLAAEAGGIPAGAAAISEKLSTSADAGAAPPPHPTESFSIVLDGWKLVHNTLRDPGAPEHELYDARKDPLNLENVAAAHPEIVERLAAALREWHAAARARRLEPDSEAAASLGAEELERLRSLGYIQ